MRRWALLTALGLALLTSCGPPRREADREAIAPTPRRETPAAPAPRAVVEGDPVHHFGIKPQQATFTRSWTIRNEGEGPLTLEPEPPPCGCVSVELPRLSEGADGTRLVIEPGGRSTITLTWKTRDRNGPYRWPLTLVTNDPRKRALTFLAEGIVRPPVALDPASGVNFPDLYDEDGDHRATITLYSPDRSDLKLTGVSTSRPDLLAVRPERLTAEQCRPLQAASGYRLEVILKPGLPPDPFREGVKVRTDHPDRLEVPFAVTGRIALPIAVVPERLRLPAVRGARGGEVAATISVRGRRKTDLRIEHRPEKIDVEIIPSDRPGTYRLKARIAPGTPSGSIRDAIILKTDHPREPEVRIPIEAIILDGN